MKLYTEEQLIKAIVLAQNCHHDCDGVYFDYNATDLMNEFIPIILPSDEEVYDFAISHYDTSGAYHYVKKGAKWVINKIKGGEQ